MKKPNWLRLIRRQPKKPRRESSRRESWTIWLISRKGDFKMKSKLSERSHSAKCSSAQEPEKVGFDQKSEGKGRSYLEFCLGALVLCSLSRVGKFECRPKSKKPLWRRRKWPGDKGRDCPTMHFFGNRLQCNHHWTFSLGLSWIW